MPQRRRRDPEGGDKRARILDAAVRVFAERGFYNARVADIADAAGIADGTIYLYFKSKDDLLISLFELHADRLISALRTALAEEQRRPSDAAAKLRRCVALHLSLAREHPALAEVLTVELRQSAKFVKEYDNPKFSEYLRLLAGLIEEGQQEGTFRRDLSARVLSRALFGAIDEVVLSYVLARRGRPDLERAAHEIADVYIEGMRARSSGGGASGRGRPQKSKSSTKERSS